MQSKVIIEKKECYTYPSGKTFRPHCNYPEYLFKGDLEADNIIYEMVREGFRDLQYDIENWGTSQWNPLGAIISCGDVVVIKPNLVMDSNPSGSGIECLITHPSVVAAVLDYVLIALQGKGEIIVGDAPMQDCNFDNLIQSSGYATLIEYYHNKHTGVMISLMDFRDLKSTIRGGYIFKK